MANSEGFVVVGAGLAGASAVRGLREGGFLGRIRLIGAEAHRPYIRPPLSKDYLSGSADRESVFVDSEAWYVENNIELFHSTTVTAIHPAEHTLTSTTPSRSDTTSYCSPRALPRGG